MHLSFDAHFDFMPKSVRFMPDFYEVTPNLQGDMPNLGSVTPNCESSDENLEKSIVLLTKINPSIMIYINFITLSREAEGLAR